jgi:ABC-2 type transport system ATP-binding protein
VLVMGRGRLLAQGALADLTRAERPVFEVRVKDDPAAFAAVLGGLGCAVEPADDRLLVELPAGRSHDLLWRAARDAGEQVRTLKPLRSSLEEVFLKAVAGLT